MTYINVKIFLVFFSITTLLKKILKVLFLFFILHIIFLELGLLSINIFFTFYCRINFFFSHYIISVSVITLALLIFIIIFTMCIVFYFYIYIVADFFYIL